MLPGVVTNPSHFFRAQVRAGVKSRNYRVAHKWVPYTSALSAHRPWPIHMGFSRLFLSVCLALGNWMWQQSVFDFQPEAPWIYLSPHGTDPRTSPRNEKKLHLPIFWVSISCSTSYLISRWWEFSLPSVDALVLYSQGYGLWLCSEQVQNTRAQ